MRRTEKEAVGISFTPTCHTHTDTDTDTHTHTNTHRTHTQPVPNHTSSDPGLRSFQTVHICSTVIVHTACVTVCVCACYPVVFLCKSHSLAHRLILVSLRVPKPRQDMSVLQRLPFSICYICTELKSKFSSFYLLSSPPGHLLSTS